MSINTFTSCIDFNDQTTNFCQLFCETLKKLYKRVNFSPLNHSSNNNISKIVKVNKGLGVGGDKIEGVGKVEGCH